MVAIETSYLKAEEVQENITGEDGAAETKPKPKKKKSVKKSKKKADSLNKDIGIHIGFLTIIPPYPSIQLSVALPKDIHVGVEYGYLAYSSKEFSASTSYTGIDLKYGFLNSDAFFYALGFGVRTVDLKDPEDYKNIGVSEDGAQTEQTYVVTWHGDVKQSLLSPRMGWKMHNKNGFIISGSLGISIPFGTKTEMTRDVESVPGKTKGDLDSEKDTKISDVNKYLTMVLPVISFGFSWYFDVY